MKKMYDIISWIFNEPTTFGHCQMWTADEAWAYADEIKDSYAYVEVRYRMADECYYVFGYPRKVKES